MPVKFDVRAAKDAGATDDEIVDFLAKQVPGFNLTKARDQLDDDEIIHLLTTGQGYQHSRTEGNLVDVDTLAKSIGKGAANFAGGMGDAAGMLAAPAWNAMTNPVPGFDMIVKNLLTGEKPAPNAMEKVANDTVYGEDNPFAGIGSRAVAPMAPYQSLEDLPPSTRPTAVAGEFIGGGLPIVAATMATAGAASPEFLAGRGLIPKILNNAKNNPKKYLTGEVKDLAYGGAGGAVAQAVDPDNPLSRLIGEGAEGLWSVGQSLALGQLGGLGSSLKQYYSKSAMKDRAAEAGQKAVVAMGEDPTELAKKLRTTDAGGLNLSAGQLAGSPALYAMEQKLRQGSEQFGGEMAQRDLDNIKTLQTQADDLAKSGKPEALAKAAQLRSQSFTTMLQKRVDLAGKEATEKQAAALGSEHKVDLPTVSSSAHDALEGALDDANKMESELWGKIPNQTIQVHSDLTNTAKALEEVSKSVGIGGSLPPRIERLHSALLKDSSGEPVESFAEATKPFDTKEVLNTRRDLLGLARDARGKGDWNTARQYSEVADGLMADLNNVNLPGADEARAFSKAKNDVFTRTFAGTALGANAKGGERVSPDLLLEKAFGPGKTAGKVKMDQLQQASAFPEGSPFAPDMQSAQERFLKIASQDTLDPKTGLVNPQKLAKFIDQNEGLLDRFPELRRDLGSAQSAQQAFQDTQALADKATNAVQRKAAFSQLLNNEDPTAVIGKVLSSNTPERGYKQLARLANKSGPGATAGLQTATLDNAFSKATKADGTMDFVALHNELRNPMSRDRPSALQLMADNKVISPDEKARLNTIINRGILIQQAGKNPARIDDLGGNADMLTDLLMKFGSAKVGTEVGKAIGGQTLVTAGVARQAGEKLINRIPNLRIKATLQEAVKDPKVMADLLERPTTITKRRELKQRLHAALFNAGIIYGEAPEDENK